jgi:hypothetical protein
MHETRFSFISKVFKFLSEDEIPIVVDASRNWRVSYPTPALAKQAPAPLYFSVAAHLIPEEGMPKRGKAYFSSAHLFVLDDIGTKFSEPPVEPSYVLETSKGNFQYGYLIRPFRDPGAFQTGMQHLARELMTDGGAVDAVHLFRLPGSLHRTGFISRIKYSDFRVRKPFDVWMKEFGVDTSRFPKTDTTRHRGPGRPTTQEAINRDQTYFWLSQNGFITEPLNEAGWVSIECPWQHTHTLTPMESSRYARYKPGTCAFKCFHEGCMQRTTNDFIRWIMEERCRAELEAAQARRA